MSAIMQGAVLHGLGYNLVKERLIRRSYGVMSSPPFVKGEHPDELRFEDESGTARCRGVMEWFACKVVQCLRCSSNLQQGERMPNGKIVEQSFDVQFSSRLYRRPGALGLRSILYTCDTGTPPRFYTPKFGILLICLIVD